MDYLERAKEVLQIEIEALLDVRGSLGEEFVCAVELLLERLRQGGKVVVTGVGKSFHIGQKMAATFTSTGSPAVTLHPSEAMHGDLGILGERDVLVALSYSGGSDELMALLPIARRRGAAILAITGHVDSPLARSSDVVVPTTVKREACPFNMAPTASTTAALALGDALAMVLLEARGFNQDDYAKLHPGGAIGRSLLLRVSDIMRTGDRLATVTAGSSVQDAVLAMTSCRAGAVAVLGEDGRLQGIFTDGDLRRHFSSAVQAGAPLTDLVIDHVMTRDPVTVHIDSLAVDILALYERHNIDDLMVLNDLGQVVGQVDIQDLPKLKIL